MATPLFPPFLVPTFLGSEAAHLPFHWLLGERRIFWDGAVLHIDVPSRLTLIPLDLEGALL